MHKYKCYKRELTNSVFYLGFVGKLKVNNTSSK